MQDINTTGEMTKTLEIIEKRAIKKAALKIGFTLLVVLGVMFFWSVPVLLITSFMGIPFEAVETFFAEPIINMSLQAVMMLFMVLLPFLILAKTEKENISNTISFARPKKRITLPLIMTTAVYGFIIGNFTSVLLSILETIGLKAPEIDMVYPTDFLGIVITVIAVVVMPSLIEEFAMRGVVLGSLRRFGDGFAIICSSLVFGLMHASITQIPYTFLLGVVLAVAVIKTESIWTSVILHAINNGLSVAFEYCEIFYGVQNTYIIEQIVICIMIITSIIGIVILLKRDPQALKIEPSNTVNGEKKKFRYFILSPTIIAGIILSILFGFLLR
ncbi:MAG: CPBP family intramembrane metalloprotease [Clostridia bacterium]|nr:CPBP family intramembrane metalloprotease [Clostridia bacterium]